MSTQHATDLILDALRRDLANLKIAQEQLDDSGVTRIMNRMRASLGDLGQDPALATETIIGLVAGWTTVDQLGEREAS